MSACLLRCSHGCAWLCEFCWTGLPACLHTQVDQDVLGKQGYRVYQSKDFCGAHDIWMKPLQHGDIAVALWNRGVCGTHSLLTLNWTNIALPPAQPMAVRDLFEEKDLGVHSTQFTGWVDIDDVLMLRLSKP